LHCAADRNSKKVAELLIQHSNILINQQNKYGWTPLHFAALQNSKEVAELLIQQPNILINQQNHNGHYALDYFRRVEERSIILEMALRQIYKNAVKNGLQTHRWENANHFTNMKQGQWENLFNRTNRNQAQNYQIVQKFFEKKHRDVEVQFIKFKWQWILRVRFYAINVLHPRIIDY